MVNHNPSQHQYYSAFLRGTIDTNITVRGLNSGELWHEGWGHVTEYFDASASENTYKNNSLVHPISIKALYFIKY